MEAPNGHVDSPLVITRHIAKNDWLAAAQCRTLAWHGLRADPEAPDEASRFRMTQGREVGELARGLFPEGILVTRKPGMTAAELTQSLLSDGSIQTLFEAAFNAGPFAAKADVLRRESAGWHLLEVKSSFSDTRELSRYVDDLAYTAMVLRRSGRAVAKASLVLLSRDYRHGQGIDALFELTDVTLEVGDRAAAFDQVAEEFARTLLSERPPVSILVSACRQCDYFEAECLGSGHRHTVLEIPNLHHAKLKKLAAAGVVGLEDLPPDFELSQRQERVRRAAASGEAVVDVDGLRAALDSVQWPCHYLDFETVSTVMPLYDGHGCHRQVLTQFSIHRRSAPDGALSHSDFLADAECCQERELAMALIDALSGEGSILVYTSFEKTRLAALSSAFPELARSLNTVADRLVDLFAIVTNHVYHPDFRGSFSIKRVLPTLVPDLSYKGLAIADGDTAIARFARMARGETTSAGVAETRVQLLEYCRLDTLAMVRLHDALRCLIA